MPKQSIWIGSWTKLECYDSMSFRGKQLQRIYCQFSLTQLATQTDGYHIQVFTGFEYYCFDHEENFLFMLTNCSIGKSKWELCNLVFGGHLSRWSFGYPWLLKYLNPRYVRTISHEKLRDVVDDFPAFYNAIKCFIQKSTIHHFTGGLAKQHFGLNLLPFSIFGFIDCSIDRISRPFSGPNEDYIGAPCKTMHNACCFFFSGDSTVTPSN